MPTESKALIEELTAQFRKLLDEHWIEFWGYCADQRAKGSIAFLIDGRRDGYKLASKLSFGIRVTHKTDAVYDPAQSELNFSDNGSPKKKAVMR